MTFEWNKQVWQGLLSLEFLVVVCTGSLIFESIKLYNLVQPEPEFRPPMSEVVQALVRLVQRANMSKRTIGNDQGGTPRGDNQPDTPDSFS